MKKLHKVKQAKEIKYLKELMVHLPETPVLKNLPEGKKEIIYEVKVVVHETIQRSDELKAQLQKAGLTSKPGDKFTIPTGKPKMVPHWDNLCKAYLQGGSPAVQQYINLARANFNKYVEWVNSQQPSSNDNESL